MRKVSVPTDSEIANTVNRILAGAHGITKSKRHAYFKREIKALPVEWQPPVENLVVFGKQLSVESASSAASLAWIGVLLCTMGISGPIAISAWGGPTLQQTLPMAKAMFLIVFALGTGFIGAAIPGTLKVKATHWHGMRIDAASGAAFFVITFIALWTRL